MSRASIELLKRQINDEYYRGNKSLETRQACLTAALGLVKAMTITTAARSV